METKKKKIISFADFSKENKDGRISQFVRDNNRDFKFENDQKLLFLDEYSVKSAISYYQVLIAFQNQEKKLHKGIAEFNLEELKAAFETMKFNNYPLLQHYMSVVKKYFVFGHDNGYMQSNILDDLDLRAFSKEIKLTTQWLDREELYLAIDEVTNFQDSVILGMIFEGVYGRGLSELLNLRMSDVDVKKHTLRLHEDTNGEEAVYSRTITVSEDLIKLIKLAYKQEYYYRDGSNASGKLGDVKIVRNDYILRPNLVGTGTELVDDVEKLKAHRIHYRLRKMTEFLGGDIDLQAKFIQRSGMVDYGKMLASKEKDINEDTVINIRYKVADRFNIANPNTISQIITAEELGLEQHN